MPSGRKAREGVKRDALWPKSERGSKNELGLLPLPLRERAGVRGKKLFIFLDCFVASTPRKDDTDMVRNAKF
jgi:hypothetical protein